MNRIWSADGEEGVTLVIVTLATLVLFGFAALAVDVGHGMGERRRAQGAVDSSALAGAVESTFNSSDLQDAVTQAVQLLDANLATPVAIADWENDAICKDTDAANRPGFDSIKELNSALSLTISPNTHCISLSRGGNEIRVTIPTLSIDTIFAGVIGVETIGINSFAQASIRFPGIGSPPPFVVLNGISGGDQTCLRASSGGALVPPLWEGNGPGVDPVGIPTLTGDPDSCDEAEYVTSDEIHGTLLPYTYTEPNPAPPNVSCSNPATPDVAWAIANGIDHVVAANFTGSNELYDGAGCTGPDKIPQPKPNTMQMQFGTTDQILTRGLLEGVTYDKIFYDGRLQRGSFVQTTYQFIGEDMDNEPLWAFLKHDKIAAIVLNNDAPDECAEVSAVYEQTHASWMDYDYYDMKELMIECIQDWNPNTDVPVFKDTIVQTSRFAFLPQLQRSDLDLDPGDNWVHFISFVPVYIQKLYSTGNAKGTPDPFCFVQHPAQTGNGGWYMHEAGQEFDCGGNNLKVDAVGSIVIECGMLSPAVCTPSGSPGGNPGPGGNPVYVIELTR